MERGMISITDNRVTITPFNGKVWMTKHEIARLFEVFISKIGANVSSILKAGLLDENKVCREIRYDNGNFARFYNLEMITALAFRIRSHNADLFRNWLMKKCTGSTSDDLIFKLIRQFEDMDSN